MATNLTWLKQDRSQNNWLVFVDFLNLQISSFFLNAVIFRHAAKKLIDFLFQIAFVRSEIFKKQRRGIRDGSQAISCRHQWVYLRGCLHDTGATFIPARVHSGSLLWLCIRLHDTKAKCHAGASHTGASSPRFLCRSEIFIPARKFIPVSDKRGMTVRFIFIKISSILRH